MNIENAFKHRIALQIRFSDIDRLHHVNNAVYHQYVEYGRVEYFNTVLKDLVNWNLHGFVLARTEMDFIHSLKYGDEAICCSKVTEIGNKSVKTETHIYHLNNGYHLAAQCKGILVCMNYSKQQSMEVPDAWKVRIKDFESA
jgi:acyl-CoA thioester hydrolase